MQDVTEKLKKIKFFVEVSYPFFLQKKYFRGILAPVFYIATRIMML
jgi:hypothetical protein